MPLYFRCKKSKISPLLLLPILLTLASCSVLEGDFSAIKTTFSVIKTSYRVAKKTVKGTIWVVSGAYELTKGATKLVYHIGKFTFEVVQAPLEYPLIRDDIQTIDGLPVKEAIRLGRVKAAPYTVKGQHYAPMSLASAQTYEETGLASVVWGGNQTPAWRPHDGQRRAVQPQRVDSGAQVSAAADPRSGDESREWKVDHCSSE